MLAACELGGQSVRTWRPVSVSHVITSLSKYMHYMIIHDVTCFTSNYIKLHVLHTITCHYISIHALHALTQDYMCCMFLHDVACSLSPTLAGGNDLQIDPPVPPLPAHLNHPPIPAPPAPRLLDPSLLIGKLCSALHANPEGYYKAVATWCAKFPVATFPDPGKHFLICEGNEPQKCP